MSLYVITGANRGFGRATALLLASSCDTEEQTLVLVGRAIEPLQRVKQEILAQTPRAKVQVIAEANLDNASTTQQSVLEPLRGLTKVINLSLTSKHPFAYFLGLDKFETCNPYLQRWQHWRSKQNGGRVHCRRDPSLF